MASKQPLRQYPVVWCESDWEKALWRPEQSFRSVLDLIESVAARYGREAFAREVVVLPLTIRVPFAVDDLGRITFGEPETRARRTVALTLTVQRAVRELIRQEAARLIKQVDVPQKDGTSRRKIVVTWDRQRAPVAAQIRKLHRAVLSKSRRAIEAAWFSLTPRAHEYLSVGYKIARRLGDVDRYEGELEIPATVIPVPMLAPDLLRMILPYAERAVALPGRRPVHPRDGALAVVLRIFCDVSGTSTGSARRGDHDEPTGPGAEFVRRIEEIFGVELMARGSTHSVARAKRRMAERPD